MIYRDGIWGQIPGQDFCSGPGSVDEIAVPYAAAVGHFLGQQGIRSVTDLGCGDFRVGRRVSALVDQYNGVDCVPDLIAHLRRTETRNGVSFHCLDLTRDPLPAAGAVLLRQVLQHLSNEQIASALRQCAHYPFSIITEHVPTHCSAPNLDHPHGPNTRLEVGSGIFLDQPPFSLNCSVLLDVPYGTDTLIRTWVVDNRHGAAR
ncbi:MAG: class I SAM-dependent methyltransferase [Acidobacteria bacterium]|nr:class I SAM-dependent methyltransferase [Acidobacteriota bacterium]